MQHGNHMTCYVVCSSADGGRLNVKGLDEGGMGWDGELEEEWKDPYPGDLSSQIRPLVLGHVACAANAGRQFNAGQAAAQTFTHNTKDDQSPISPPTEHCTEVAS